MPGNWPDAPLFSPPRIRVSNWKIIVNGARDILYLTHTIRRTTTNNLGCMKTDVSNALQSELLKTYVKPGWPYNMQIIVENRNNYIFAKIFTRKLMIWDKWMRWKITCIPKGRIQNYTMSHISIACVKFAGKISHVMSFQIQCNIWYTLFPILHQRHSAQIINLHPGLYQLLNKEDCLFSMYSFPFRFVRLYVTFVPCAPNLFPVYISICRAKHVYLYYKGMRFYNITLIFLVFLHERCWWVNKLD